MESAAITIEFYGMARARAGLKELHVSASTVRAALDAILKKCPDLQDLRSREGAIAPPYLLSLDGESFITNVEHVLRAGDRLLVLSADVGG